MATVTRYINTASTAGGDGTTNNTSGATRAFVSSNEWEAAEETDLVTDTDVHVVIADGGADTTDVAISGWTTGASNGITFKCVGGAHDGTPGSGYYLSSSVAGTLRPAEDYIDFDSVEVRNTSTNSAIIWSGIGASNQHNFTKMLIHNSVSSNTGYTINASATNLNLDIENTAVWGGSRTIDTRNATAINITYVSAYLHTDQLGFVCSSEATIKNTYCGKSSGSNQDFWTGGAAPSGNNNISSDTTATTDFTSSLVSKAPGNQFVSLTGGSEDLHLKSGSDCETAGVSIGGITTDIDGDSRDGSTPDVGFDEFVSAGGGLGIPIAAYHYNHNTGSNL